MASSYVISQEFETKDSASALAQAAAWLTLQGDAIDFETVVGDENIVTLYYQMKQEQVTYKNPATGSLTVISPSSVGGYTQNKAA